MKHFVAIFRLVGVFAIAAVLAASISADVRAQDVCVSINGSTKVQGGNSSCSSDGTSAAIAVGGSSASATTGSTAIAINNSSAIGHFESQVRAVNGSTGTANTEAVRDNCRVTVTNGATGTCP